MTEEVTVTPTEPTTAEKLAMLEQLTAVFGKEKVAGAVNMDALLKQIVGSSSLPALEDQVRVEQLNQQSADNMTLAREDPNLHYAEATVLERTGGNKL